MKKRSFLAIFMVIVLCLSMMLVGCQKDEAKKNNDEEKETAVGVQDNTQPETPTEDTTEPKKELTIEEAMNNTMDALFTTDCSAPVLEDLSEKKVITASMDGLFSNVLNLDVAGTAFYDELSVSVEGETVTGHIYCDGKDLAVTSPELLGEGIAVGVNFSTFAEDLEASGLLDLLLAEFGGELAELESALTQIAENAEAINKTNEELFEALEEIAQGVEYSQSEGTATVYGAETDAVIFTYTMDKDDFKKFIDLFLKLAEETYQAELDAMISAGTITAEEAEEYNIYAETQKELDAAWGDVEMSGVMNFYANPENGCIMLMEGIYTGTIEGETLDTTMTLSLGESPATSGKYVLAMDMGIDGTQMMAMELALSNTTDGSIDTTALTFNAEVEGEEMNILNVTAAYNSETTAYELTVEADGEKIAAKGTMDSAEDKFVITVDALEAAGESLPLGITLSIENNPDCEIPSVPEYANVLTDLGLAEMLEDQMGTEDYEDYEEYENDEDYDEDYES